MVQEQQEVIRS